MKWSIGCSGFSNNNWVGYFYPKDLSSKEWLEFYAQNFDTLELNSSFYTMPTASLLKNLYQRTPPTFGFIVKAPKLITHTNRFKDVEIQISKFYNVLELNLKEKLGAVLFQMPPSFVYSEGNLKLVIQSLDLNFKNVIEFRHKSWWNENVFEELGQNKICFCGVSYPNLPSEPIVNTDFAYYRFHGVPKMYYSMYPTEFLSDIEQSYEKHKDLNEVFLLFNNTASRAALENASYLQQLVSL